MLATLVLFTLAAAPDVVATTGSTGLGPATRKALEAGLGGKPIDASRVWEALFLLGPSLPIHDFEGFKAAPPSGWPQALKPEWSASLEHCATIVGPPPWRETLTSAMCCSLRAGSFLWGRYLDNLGARRVVELQVTDEPGSCEVHASLFDVKARTLVRALKKCTHAKIDAVTAGLVKSLFANQQIATAWYVYDAVSTPAKTDAFEGKAASTAKLELKRACAAPPGAVAVAQDTVLGKAFAARWAATVPAGGAPHECTLEQFLHREPETLSEGQWQDTFTAVLTCPEASVSAEVAMRPGPGVDLVSKLLVERLAAKLCR